MPTLVTDPAILAQLNGKPAGRTPVTDPAILAQLNSAESDVAVPPDGLKPGTREYADWAAASARAGKRLPQVSDIPPTPAAAPAPTGPLDQINAGFTNAVNAVPIAGPAMLRGLESAKATLHGTTPEAIAADDKMVSDANPIASNVGGFAGTVLPFAVGGMIPGVSKGLGMAGSLAERVAFGGMSGAGISAADAKVRGKPNDEVVNDALLGGGIGAGLPLAATAIKSIATALRAPQSIAPAAAVLKAEAGAGYDAARATGAQFKPTVFAPLAQDAKAIAMDGGAVLPDGKIASGFNRLKAAIKASEQYGAATGPVSLEQQKVLRSMFANAADSTDKVEARIGVKMLDQFDHYFENLPDTAFAGNSPTGAVAMSAIASARQEYAQAMRTQTIEKLITKAERSGGNAEAYRTQFRALLNSERRTRGFPPDQLAAIDRFVRGGPLSGIVSLFSSAGSLPSAFIGGATGGPVGAAAGFVAAPIARALSGRAAAGGAEAIRGAVSGAPAPSAIDRIAAALKSANDNPANPWLSPVSAALLGTRQ